MNANLNLSNRDFDRLARLWIRAWRQAGSPGMAANETTWRYPALTRIPAAMCGIKTMKEFKNSTARISVECCGRERGARGKSFLVRVALDYTTITHIVAPLAGLTMNIGGTANIECASGQRGVVKAMLVQIERMHIEVATHLRFREALHGMSGPVIDAAYARIEEAEIRDALPVPASHFHQTPAGRL